ncbi:MAG TPA: serine hydrolase domain-containing protein [Gaiellaceae bacterium]|jgi:D-alanyl-D-alanine carboxypeptidase
MRALAAIGIVLLLAGCGGSAQRERPGLQRTVDSLVTGPRRLAPGVTAFVSGPHGTWSGSAGWADVTKQVRMTPDARLRLESVSKLWTATVLAKLATERKLSLDDTVARWLPGLFPYGNLITIRELLNHTSGMVDNNDFDQRPQFWLGQIHDRALRAELLATAAEIEEDRAHVYPTMLLIRAAAALPLQFDPATSYHYSNIGYETAGVIAERAADEGLADLYRRIIIDPLGLKSAAYAPHGPIPGPHPVGYVVRRDGTTIAATRWDAGGLAAEGAIVVNARDEARFLVALVRGEIVPPAMLAQMLAGSGPNPSYGLGTVVERTCAGKTLSHNGGGASWTSSVAVSVDGSRVAVLLLNGRRAGDIGDPRPALLKLFCAA